MFDKHGDPWGNRNIISKRYQKAGTGWQLMFSNNTQVEFAANFKEGSSVFRLPSTRRDGSWHSYTLVIKEVDDTQKGDSILFYLDGKYQMGCKIDGSKDMWTDAPLAIGHTFSPDRPSQANLYINDLQFYNVALPADIIAEYHCTTKLDLWVNYIRIGIIWWVITPTIAKMISDYLIWKIIRNIHQKIKDYTSINRLVRLRLPMIT